MDRPDDLANRLLRYPSSARSRLRIAWLRLLGARIGRRCRLMRVDIPRNPWDIEIGSHVALDAGVILLSTGPRARQPRIRIGSGTYCNRHVFLDASQEISIGSDCMIGPFCYITDHDHGTAPGRDVVGQPLRSGSTRVGRGAWLGAHVIVLRDVDIGENTVVGAGSVVTRSLPPGVIAAGQPARVIRSRG